MLDVEHGTHLTINGGRSVQTDKVGYHTQETRHACKGVDLLNK